MHSVYKQALTASVYTMDAYWKVEILFATVIDTIYVEQDLDLWWGHLQVWLAPHWELLWAHYYYIHESLEIIINIQYLHTGVAPVGVAGSFSPDPSGKAGPPPIGGIFQFCWGALIGTIKYVIPMTVSPPEDLFDFALGNDRFFNKNQKFSDFLQ